MRSQYNAPSDCENWFLGPRPLSIKFGCALFFPNVAKLARLTAFISRTKRSTKKLNYNLLTNFFSSIWITKKPFWVYKHFKNYFCMLNIERSRAHQSLITFFYSRANGAKRRSERKPGASVVFK